VHPAPKIFLLPQIQALKLEEVAENQAELRLPAKHRINRTMVAMLRDEIVRGHGDGGELRTQRGIARQRQER